MAQAQTPAAGQSKKQLHWAVQFAASPIPSSDSRDTSSIADPAPATLQYVNSQLIAHGFTSAPGISLDGLPGSKADKVVKTLFGLLGQRMEDLQRTEDLSTKLRTLSYDYERLMTMHKSASAAAAEAERETSTVKSKLANSAKALSQSEAAHKQTQVELQRTRTSLQALRSQHVAELKKRDAEHARMADRWSKLSDSQLKVHTIPARMIMPSPTVPSAAANAQILEGGQKALVDAALETAESAAKQLREENAGLRQLVLDSANAVRKILHKATVPDPDDFVYPAPLEVADVFAPCATPAAEGAFTKLSELLTALRNAVTALRSGEPRLATSAAAAGAGPSRPDAQAEVDRLQRTVEALCEELELAQTDARAHATRAEDLFAQLSAKPSVDAKAVDELESQRGALDEAALNVGRDRAALESERLQFLAEKRAWEMSRILANEAPPRPNLSHPVRAASPAPSPPTSPPPQRPVRATSPHRSPRKARSHAVSPRKSKHKSPLKPPRSRVTAAFETEVVPAPQQKLLRTSFALPPPTPQSWIAPLNFGEKKAKQSDGEKRLAALFTDSDKAPAWPTTAQSQAADEAATESTTPPYPPTASASGEIPSEPHVAAPASVFPPPVAVPAAKNPFPAARVNAPRMVHAYSPARPSPLSRILALAQSPESSTSGAVGPPKLPSAFAALEESELETVATNPSSSGSGYGIIDEGSPLRDKAPSTATTQRDDKKGKRRADSRAGAEEKENTIRRKLRGPAHAPRPPAVKKSTGPGAGAAVRNVNAGPSAGPGPSRTGARPAQSAAVAGKGPRRVPVAGSEITR